MQISIEHNWMVEGPGGYYGLLQYQTGSRWLDSNTGIMLGPFTIDIPLPVFEIVAIVNVAILIMAFFVYARRTCYHNAA